MQQQKPVGRAKRALKETAVNWPAIVAVVCFSAVTIVFAHRVDGDEALKILVGAVGAFFATFLGYLFTGRKE